MLAKDLLSDWNLQGARGRKLLLGVSGGADSVALLLALHETLAPDQLMIAHLDHGWRGQESADDSTFVSELCQRLQRPCILHALRDRDKESPNRSDDKAGRENAMLAKSIDEEPSNSTAESEDNRKLASAIASNNSSSELETFNKTEESARRARYEFFKQAAYSVGASYVVTAHTADDRAETVLHNLLRGTGLTGAASLVMFRSFAQDLVLARPLLRKRRWEIEAFLRERGQSFREDSSNQLTHFCRNFLRREVLPALRSHYPSAVASLVKFSELVEEQLLDLDRLASAWLQTAHDKQSMASDRLKIVREQWPASIYFVAPVSQVVEQPWSVVHTALRRVWSERDWPQADMSRDHWHSIRTLCQLETGVLQLPGNLRAEAFNAWLIIGPENK